MTRTPYDTGTRLEPHPWVQDGQAPRRHRDGIADEDAYGRVDFDDEEGATIATVYIDASGTTHGDVYALHLDVTGPVAILGPGGEWIGTVNFEGHRYHRS